MKKLYKKENRMQETIEAYDFECSCSSSCRCRSSCKTKVGKAIKQFGNFTADVIGSKNANSNESYVKTRLNIE